MGTGRHKASPTKRCGVGFAFSCHHYVSRGPKGLGFQDRSDIRNVKSEANEVDLFKAGERIERSGGPSSAGRHGTDGENLTAQVLTRHHRDQLPDLVTQPWPAHLQA